MIMNHLIRFKVLGPCSSLLVAILFSSFVALGIEEAIAETTSAAAPIPHGLDLEYVPTVNSNQAILYMEESTLPEPVNDAILKAGAIDTPSVDSPLLSQDFEDEDFERLGDVKPKSVVPKPVPTQPAQVSPTVPTLQVKTLPVPQPVAPVEAVSAAAPVIAEKPVPLTEPRLVSHDLPEQTAIIDAFAAAHPTAYTIQLVASTNKAAIEQLISAHHLQTTAKIFHSYRQTKDWYTLTYGIYPSQAQAALAIQNLPLALQEAQPWPRSIKSLQQFIKKNQ